MKQVLRRWGPRAVGLLVTAFGLYVVAPSVVALLGQWPQLRDVKAEWFVILFVLEVSSWACLWVLVHMLLPSTPWPTVGSAQLAGLASGCVLPGGSATGSVIQASVLVRAGNGAGQVAAALGSVGLLTTGMLLTLPILTVPAVIIRPPPARQLQLGLVVSLVVAAVLVLLGLAVLHWDSFVNFVGRMAGRFLHLVRRGSSVTEVAERVVAQRDQVAAAFAGFWGRALCAAAGNRMLDYAALVAAVYAVGGRVRPSMVLLAYVLSLALALVPLTPGGLGFVEAGLTSILVLAGVDSDQAVVATLLYRLVSFWLPIPVGALAWAGWRFTAGQQGRPMTQCKTRGQTGRRSPCRGRCRMGLPKEPQRQGPDRLLGMHPEIGRPFTSWCAARTAGRARGAATRNGCVLRFERDWLLPCGHRSPVNDDATDRRLLTEP